MKKTSIELPNINWDTFSAIDPNKLSPKILSTHPAKILLLYGSIRERSFSRLVIEETQRLLNQLGAETKVFNPTGLPQPDSQETEHPKVQELHDLVTWCEGMVWCSPERHGSITGIMKSQID